MEHITLQEYEDTDGTRMELGIQYDEATYQFIVSGTPINGNGAYEAGKTPIFASFPTLEEARMFVEKSFTKIS